MSENELSDLHGDRSANHIESLLVNNPDWFKRHQNQYVVYGDTEKLASEATAEKAMEVATEVAEEKGVRPDYIAFIDRQFKLDAIAARNEGQPKIGGYISLRDAEDLNDHFLSL